MTAHPLRIVHCLRAPVGGAFRHVCDLISAQRAQGHRVGLICDASSGGAFAEQRLSDLSRDLELGLVRIPMRRTPSLSDLATMRSAYRDLKAMAPDVVHGHGAKGGVYARILGTLLRRSGLDTRRFYTPHGGSLHYDPKAATGRVFFAVERALERVSDGLCFVCDYEADQYRTKVGAPRIPHRTVHNGLRPQEFEPVIPAPDARDFLFIGEFRELKGPDVFLKALRDLGDETGKTPTAHMVGPGEARTDYETMAHDLGLGEAVAFHGAMPARAAFSTARAVVIPSRAESLPYIILEAIAAGLPVITTRVGGIAEIFREQEKELVPAGDHAALAQAMQRVLTAPQETRRKAEKLRDSLSDGFSLKAMSDGVLTLYAEGGVSGAVSDETAHDPRHLQAANQSDPDCRAADGSARA
ncbi:glycosyltransferase family 4 protein [Breoghania sp.]|uniref:glycosyltransferase family 4 protein n=1 Tax=Breoghania sp. TaxID=2065378 RepID=UPI002AA6962E|nr:glycosyltransferase family 4 protein [Breoghania sp.]